MLWEVCKGVSQEQSLLQRTVDQIVDIPVPSGCLEGTLPEQGSTTVCRGGGFHDSLPDQGSTAFFGVTGPGGGPQDFVPGQSSTALGGADDVEDLIRRSQGLIDNTRRENSFSSNEEEEEETEQMDLEEQPSRFQGISAPGAIVYTSSRGNAGGGSSCTFAHS